MAEPASTPETAPEASMFEQPLNERMRTFLRLDFLYSQALFHNEKGSPWGTRAAVDSLLDILAILTRGDVRSDVLKELERHLVMLNEFQNRAGIDAARLRALLTNLVRLRSELTAVGGSWLQPLRDSEFLAAIKQRSAIPGGTCEFDLPDYFFWLNQPAESRMHAFGRWLSLLRPLCDAIAELLWLTRQNGRPREERAAAGVFNVTFDRDTPYQLLRISVPPGIALYPEISGSHYRCSMRFLQWHGIDQRSTPSDADVPFTLICCT
ncbi:MAG: cell division protein ZapD [Steroidobacteraceae bacterium]|jgi:cell division protein ZapD